MKKPRRNEITDYDQSDTTERVDQSKVLSLKNLGLKLPPTPPTQVVSIRLPTALLNVIRAKASARDVPYQSLIKMLLSRSLHWRSAA